MKQIKISEVVTFIKPTREEAITLAYEIGGGEVHALTIMRGFSSAVAPVGYMVTPWEYKTEAAFRTLERLGYEFCGGEEWKPPLGKIKEQK
jgi:hypothetical protein